MSYETCFYCVNTCQSCNTCQGGYTSCSICNKPAYCQSCNTDCQTSQAGICTENGNCLGLSDVFGTTFTFSVRPTKDTGMMCPNNGMFNASVWQEIIDYYNNGTLIGNVSHFFGSSLADPPQGSLSPFTAAEYNRVSAAVGGNYTVSSGDLIEGRYFTDLETAVSTKRADPNACDKCNTGCDGCNTCQTCNRGCQTPNTGCSTCNTCQTCNQKCNTWYDDGCYDTAHGHPTDCYKCNTCETAQGTNVCCICNTGCQLCETAVEICAANSDVYGS